MNGVHDLGGRYGFGHVEPQVSSRAFDERWQASVFTILNRLLAIGHAKNVDHFRHAVERIDPVSYLTDTYYGRWLGAVETLLVEAGVLTVEEITGRAVERGADSLARVAARPSHHPDQFSDPAGPANVSPPVGAARPGNAEAVFQIGQRVRTRKTNPSGHTRLPSYALGMCGEVVAQHGEWVFPDTNAHGHGEHPSILYTVAFAGSQLWGSAAEPSTSVRIDLFENYLMKQDD